MSRAPRLLVFTRHNPIPSHDGASAYLFDLLAYLASHEVQVDVAWLAPDPRLCANGVWHVPDALHRTAHLHLPDSFAVGRLRIFPLVHWLPFKARTLHRAKRLLQLLHLMSRRRRPSPPAGPAVRATPPDLSWLALPSGTEHAYAHRLVSQLRPDVVLANFAWLTPLLTHARRARKLVLTHDVASDRARALGRKLPGRPVPPHLATLEAETELLALADQVLAISHDDAATFRGSGHLGSVHVVPKAAHPHGPRDLTGEIAGRCLFVGGVNPPNQEGLDWFLRLVWPAVRAARPDASLHVCGAICDSVANPPPPGVALCGRLDDLAPEYAAAAVVVVPLLTGTGMKIKLVEAASHASACVSTGVGLQGLDFLRSAVAKADTAADFSAQIVDLLQWPERRHDLGRRLQAATLTHLSPDNCYRPVLNTLRALPRRRAFPLPAFAKTTP